MPWDSIKLNNGKSIPSIAYGTFMIGQGPSGVDRVGDALNVGFEHIDTAQAYRNEEEAGRGFRESGLAREEVFITTKYSGKDGMDMETSIHQSLDKLGVKYVDLYLIHQPWNAVPDIPTAWAKMEKLQADGLAKCIGISNFSIDQLQTLLDSCKVKPQAHQILFHPYVLEQQMPLVELGIRHGIVSEAYSALIPITRTPGGGPLDSVLDTISERLKAKPEQILLAWVKAKGLVVVTMSTKKERMQGYIAAGDIDLTEDDIAAIDSAGIIGGRRLVARTRLKRVAIATCVGALAFGAWNCCK